MLKGKDFDNFTWIFNTSSRMGSSDHKVSGN